MLTVEEEKWAHVWREAHEIAAREMPRIEARACKLPGFAALLANFAIAALKEERERCAKVADEWAADGDWDPDCCRGIAAQIRDPESAEPQL